jgi:GT2 family glycosyltransferase
VQEITGSNNPWTAKEKRKRKWRQPAAGKILVGMTVSICIPTYNGARFVTEALRSAWLQKDAAEAVISDSGSTDGTMDLVRQECRNAPIPCRILDKVTPGMVPNWNALVKAANGEFIKFLFQDDRLNAGCITKMMAAAEGNPAVSLVFCRRNIVVEKGSEQGEVAQYLLKYADLHTDFGKLATVQPGSKLLGAAALLSHPENKIGEPTAVMFRKDLAISVGLFNEKMHQLVDWEFWLRLMARGDVAFIDEALVNFRIHDRQATSQNVSGQHGIADSVELLQTLSSNEVFPNLHGQSKREIYRRSKEWGVPISQQPGAVYAQVLELKSNLKTGRKELSNIRNRVKANLGIKQKSGLERS